MSRGLGDVYKRQAIRNEWKELSARMGNIRLLTQEEIETLQQQSAKLLKHEKALQQKNEEIQRKIRWIEQLEQINLNRKPRPPFRMPKKYKPKHKPSQSGYSRWKASKAAVFFGLKKMNVPLI